MRIRVVGLIYNVSHQQTDMFVEKLGQLRNQPDTTLQKLEHVDDSEYRTEFITEFINKVAEKLQ